MIKSSDILLLLFLGKKCKLFNRFSTSTIKIARELNYSQQSVSRKLLELEKHGFIERQTTVNGVSISLKHSAIELLREHFTDLQFLFSKTKTKGQAALQGRVVSGLGEGRYYLGFPQYVVQIEKKFGFSPYPGTLNIKVELEKLEAFLSSLIPIYVQGFEIKERTFGGFTGYNVSLPKKISAALIIPDRTSHEKNEVEIIASPFLRKRLSLKDGSVLAVNGVVG